MYVVVVYDMQAGRTRLAPNFLRRHLMHAQNSVFEGEITEGDLETVTDRLEELLESDESAIVYEMSSESYVDRTVVGDDPTGDARFL